MKKPKEFWIEKEYAEEHYDGVVTLEIKPDQDKIDNFVHVIEYSAYKEVKTELERLRNLVTETTNECLKILK